MGDLEKRVAILSKIAEWLDRFAKDRCDRVDALWCELCAANEKIEVLLEFANYVMSLRTGGAIQGQAERATNQVKAIDTKMVHEE